ncbi:hypothetical protein BDZ45DRAFT_69975 [Acephala macrosclerotiorum]|nr:hypothetical protein BDZ45DRAFT_69975 [Acephala macrosclerotiorum]
MDSTAANIDLEKVAGTSGQPPYSPNSQSTWESQDDTLNSPVVADRIVIEEDTDEESAQAQKPASLLPRFLKAITPKCLTNSPSQPFRTIIRKLERCEEGYPYLATFLDSDENFMIYRRFGFIHARLLLQKQDELRIMEEELDRMDRRDKFQNTKALQCRMEDVERQDQIGETRQALLARMENTILRYDELLLKAQQLAAANRPPERDYNSVANFVRHKKPLMQGDDDFIYNKEDLITLRPGRESAWLDAMVEKLLKLFPRTAVKYIFCSKETAAKTTDESLFLPTKARVDRLVSCLIMITVLALLIVPVYALYHVGSSFNKSNASTSNAICIGILLVATLLFSAALALFTKAKRHELLGAAAAYCALLVVFIANLGINNVT